MRTFFKVSCFAILAAGVLLSGCSKKDPQLVDPGDVPNPDGPVVNVPDPGAGSGDDPYGGDRGGHGDFPATLTDVFFDLDTFSLRSDARRGLDDNAATILRHPDWSVVLEGHCDERGTVEYNLALGQKRADSVRGYLAELGVPIGQMRSISYGEESPFDPGHNESAWADNRRVHFVR